MGARPLDYVPPKEYDPPMDLSHPRPRLGRVASRLRRLESHVKRAFLRATERTP